MGKINFTKMVASGNDFVIAEIKNQKSKIKKFSALAKKICNRKFGIGADGLLILSKSKVSDIRMRIFNADGSEAEMCGNGARCVGLFKSEGRSQKARVRIETKAGIIDSQVRGDNVKIKLTRPKGIRLGIPIMVGTRLLKVNFINTGVPHTVIFVEGLDKIDVVNLGRMVRFHKNFTPKGTNVDFVEVLGKNLIGIRTYERGVEDETLACGTGAVASALICALKTKTGNKIRVLTKGGEVLTVYFRKQADRFKDVWLEGQARIVYKGEYYVK
jgi:diaminopimelate epimerase